MTYQLTLPFQALTPWAELSRPMHVRSGNEGLQEEPVPLPPAAVTFDPARPAEREAERVAQPRQRVANPYAKEPKTQRKGAPGKGDRNEQEMTQQIHAVSFSYGYNYCPRKLQLKRC